MKKKYAYRTTQLYRNRKSIKVARKGPLLYIRIKTLNNTAYLEAQRCIIAECASTIYHTFLLDLFKAQGQLSEDFVRWISRDLLPFLDQQSLTHCFIILPEANSTIHSIIMGLQFKWAYEDAFSFTLQFPTSYRDAKKLIEHSGTTLKG